MDLKATGIAVTIAGSTLCEKYTTGSSKYVIEMILIVAGIAMTVIPWKKK